MERALIIGGTKGLGLAIAREVSRNGIMPIIAGRSVHNDEIRKSLPVGALPVPLDLTDSTSIGNLHYHLRDVPARYVFWVSGIFKRKPLYKMTHYEMREMIQVHLKGPLDALKLFEEMFPMPYHLVVIASTSSWKLREDEALYCALKAAKAHFARNYTVELIRDRPGSKVTLFNPGGMRTELWKESGQDMTGYMDPCVVAKAIWDEVSTQRYPFAEFQIERNHRGVPIVRFATERPEVVDFNYLNGLSDA